MACEQLDVLEEAFIKVRNEIAEVIWEGQLPSLALEMKNLAALSEIMHHQIAHADCNPS